MNQVYPAEEPGWGPFELLTYLPKLPSIHGSHPKGYEFSTLECGRILVQFLRQPGVGIGGGVKYGETIIKRVKRVLWRGVVIEKVMRYGGGDGNGEGPIIKCGNYILNSS